MHVSWKILAIAIAGVIGAAEVAAAECLPAAVPVIAVPATAPGSHTYTIAWDGDVALTPSFELQEATSDSFADAVTIAVSGALSKSIAAHSGVTADTRFFYRVRGIAACSGQAGEFSRSASIVVAATQSGEAADYSIGLPEGTTQPFVQDYLVPGFGETATIDDRFTLTLDAPWVTVFPAEGALSAGGTTVQFTIDPTKLSIGSSSATLTVKRTQLAGSVTALVPLSVSLAPPVRPLPRSVAPPAGTLIVPGVAHADGSNSHFQSDVRLTNSGAESVTYELAYTPTASDGTLTGKKASVDVAPNETKAFNDIVKMFFGSGLLGESGIGSLEIRPLRTASGAEPPSGTTFASSRTYNASSAGTFGQFIPALARAAFIANVATDPLAKISLQQVASNATNRTNVGFVEGKGEPAQLNVRLFDPAGTQLRQVSYSLKPFEHRQLNLNDATLFPGVTLDDARLEVEVTSATGLVTAYASVLDNQTSDPLLVSPVQAGRIATSRTVLPGVAELTSAKNFHTDMQIYNAGTAITKVTLSYRPQTGDSTAIPPEVSAVLDVGEVLPIDNVLPSFWGLSGTGGAVTLTTTSPAPLVVSARTFSRNATNGTFGQFIPGVTSTDAVGAEERALQVLQLEQSANFRSNLGVFEVTGNPATVEITGYSSSATTTPVMVFELSAGEFRQLGAAFAQLGLPTVYNGRIAVRVLAGSGRVSAYASVIDSRTEDPTYIPAQ